MSEIKEQTYHSANGRRMLTFSFFADSFHISHAFWTKNQKAIVGDMEFTLTPEEAVRTAELVLDKYRPRSVFASAEPAEERTCEACVWCGTESCSDWHYIGIASAKTCKDYKRKSAEERGPEVGDVVYIRWLNGHQEVTTYSALLQAEIRGATVITLMRRADVEARIKEGK